MPTDANDIMINGPVIDTAIPSYNPDGKLLRLLEMLHSQSLSLRKIHLIQTGKEGLAALLQSEGISEGGFEEKFPLVSVVYINAEDFDHGATRDMGMNLCGGADYCLFMTQDAVPLDNRLIENLYKGFGNAAGLTVAAVYGRQVAREDASEAEKVTRQFNYPDTPQLKSAADIERLGVKTFFCSNVCAMYRRDLYEEIGGFETATPFNEDMIYAGHAVKKGYAIYYAPDARVYHSHDYTPVQQLRRNFDLGASQTDHPEVFGNTGSVGEGKKLVSTVLKHLAQTGRLLEIPGFIAGCAGRYLGYSLGKNYRKLSRKRIMKLTMNKVYWKRRFSEEDTAEK